MGFSRSRLLVSSAAIALSAVSYVAPPAVGHADTITFETPSVVDPIHPYGEPDVGIDAQGRVFASGPWGTGTQHSIWNASTDGGHVFALVNQGLPPNPVTGIDDPPGGGDTDIAFDKSGKQYFADLAGLTCVRTETTSDGGGSTFQNTAGNCTSTNGPGADRQWLAVYDPPLGTPKRTAYTGPTPLIYMEVNQTVTLLSIGTNWLFSNAAVDPEPGGPGLAYMAASTNNISGTGPLGADGRPAIDQVTGKVFQAFPNNGGLDLNIGTPTATGTLNFLDPNYIPISSTAPSGLSFQPLSMDAGRNLWVSWTAGGKTYVSVSPPHNDQWDQWSPAVQVSQQLPGDVVDVFPWIKAGGAGRADIVWYGMDKTGDPSIANNQSWNVYMSQLTLATNPDGSVQVGTPTINPAKVSPHPMHYNDVCLSGTGCITNSPPGNRNLADFFQVNIDSTGAAEIVYADTSNGLSQPGFEPNNTQLVDHPGAPLVTLARQNGGPGLKGGSASGPSSAPVSGISDPTTEKDAQFPVITGLAPSTADPGMDVAASQMSLSGSTLTVKMKVTDLSNPAATAAGSGGAAFLQYITRWQMGNVIYYAGAEIPTSQTPGGQSPQFFAGAAQSIDQCSVSGCDPHVLVYPEGTLPSGQTANVALGKIESGSTDCSSAPPCTISINVNVADIGGVGPASLLEQVGAYTFAAARPQATTTNAQAEADQVPLEVDGVCCYNWAASAGPGGVPEAPLAPALLLVGVTGLAGGVIRQRRRAASRCSRRAVVVQRARRAIRLARQAHPAPVEDQAQAQVAPLLGRHHRADLGLDLDRVGLTGEPDPPRQAGHVGVDRKARQPETNAKDDVGGLAPDPGQRHQVLHPRRHLAAVALDQRPGAADDGVGLGPEEAGWLDQLFDVDWVGVGRGGGVWVAGKERQRDLVDPLVSGLRGQDGRDQELQWVGVVELADGFGIEASQASYSECRALTHLRLGAELDPDRARSPRLQGSKPGAPGM